MTPVNRLLLTNHLVAGLACISCGDLRSAVLKAV
jgi:hypothetical protein